MITYLMKENSNLFNWNLSISEYQDFAVKTT